MQAQTPGGARRPGLAQQLDARDCHLLLGDKSPFGEQLSRLHAMVEDLSKHGRLDHLLTDLPGELVPLPEVFPK